MDHYPSERDSHCGLGRNGYATSHVGYSQNDTIAAQATPPGSGGVGIIRVSGPLVPDIMQQMLQRQLTPRYAYYGDFYGVEGELLDRGIAIYFAAPNSFTGEEILELQGHGGQIVLQRLLQRTLTLGARLAEPGEFSYRAFCHHKMDLTQAEAIADLIAASSELAAKQAVRSLRGDFAMRIQELVTAIVVVRTQIEYQLDFNEEENETGGIASDQKDDDATQQLINAIDHIYTQLHELLARARQGAKLREGLKVAIIGKPNAGKSTLFNYLCGCTQAIVTDIPGTTRDLLRAEIQLAHKLQFELIDTAGIREQPDQIEAIGIAMARQTLASVDHILYLIDAAHPQPDDGLAFLTAQLPQRDNQPHGESSIPVTILYNKIDLLPPVAAPAPTVQTLATQLWQLSVSFKTGQGCVALEQHLVEQLAPKNLTETGFSARERHLVHLCAALANIKQARQLLLPVCCPNCTLDLLSLAEELRLAHHQLNQITGQDQTQELLDSVFKNFCVGK